LEQLQWLLFHLALVQPLAAAVVLMVHAAVLNQASNANLSWS
tara:strand:- start:1688 stop:1813 length:126 start_codon:yes stop_codon:yes gene_type:complete